MYELTTQNSFSVLYYKGAIKNKYGYYSPAAKIQREYTASVLAEIPSHITYIDGCCATGIKAMYAMHLKKKVIAVDAFVSGTLIRTNFSMNGFYNNYQIYNASICDLTNVRFEDSILDLDVYGNSIWYLQKMVVVNKYLFLTFTDLMNICGAGARNFFKKFEVRYIKVKPWYEQAIRALIYVVYSVTKVPYVPIATCRFTKYLRLYLKKSKNLQVDTGSLCQCGIYYTTSTCCPLCHTDSISIGPVYTGKIPNLYFFGFNKTQVFKHHSFMPTDAEILNYFTSQNCQISKSGLDADYFSLNIYGLALAELLLRFH